MKTNQLFQQNNRDLMLRLIPNKDLPIYGNSFTNPKDITFDHTLKEIESISNSIKEVNEIYNEK